MKFVDQVKIHIKAGDGGRGCLSFRREKFIPRGGPDGGDGGNGGDVYLHTDSNMTTLLDFRYNAHYKATNGAHGMGKHKHGKAGESLVINVPPGTLVYNAETDELITDLNQPDQTYKLLNGGMGGRGNARFTTSTNRAPRHTQPGVPGENITLRMDLKLIADVGLVGMPNAGKSTLIRAVSSARPKVADYPFTTLVPNLGVVRYAGFKSFVMADIPGLIEGASAGQGLGTRFLRHVERTDFFLHLVDLTTAPEDDYLHHFNVINNELKRHDETMLAKPQLVILTKNDITEVRELARKVTPLFTALGYPVFCISAVTGDGIKELIEEIGTRLDHFRNAEA
jgi:GTP-binding protein